MEMNNYYSDAYQILGSIHILSRIIVDHVYVNILYIRQFSSFFFFGA